MAETETMTTTTNSKTNADMTADATETSLGICGYRSPSIPGFSGVLKGRFSDFLVHEVSLDGTKAELTCLDAKITSRILRRMTSVPPTMSSSGEGREDNAHIFRYENVGSLG